MSETRRRQNARIYLDWVIENQMNAQPLLPALGGGLVRGGALVYAGIRGIRKRGSAVVATIDDRFQLGSITKPITGFMLAVLKSKGSLDWPRTIGQTWPDLIDALPAALGNVDGRDAWVAHYRDTTIVDLMTHSSGFDYMPATETDAKLATANAVANAALPAKRRIYTRLALLDRPYHGWSSMVGAPPVKYSGGCIVAAAMAEKVTGKSWETLVVERVFQPLGITRWSLANASSKTQVTDLWQHQLQNGTVVARAIPNESHIAFTHGPAGAVSLSIGDWAKWAKALLATSSTSLIKKSALDDYFGLPDADYNCTRGGWFGGGGRFSHDGCNMWNYATMTVDRGKRMAVLAATNIYTDTASQATAALAGEMEGVSDAWPAMEHLHEALAIGEASVSATSVWDNTGNYHPTLMLDAWFRTRWASASSTPIVTATLQTEGWLKGIAICQVYEARIGTFEIEITSSASPTPAVLKGAALASLTQREGLVVKVLFAAPMLVKKLVLKVKTANGPPTVSKLMLMAYNATAAGSFDIANDGRLWITDGARHVRTASAAIGTGTNLLDIDPGGSAGLVRKAAGKPWLIGDDARLWHGEPNGWFPVAGSPQLKRIAVDLQGDVVWAITSTNIVRKLAGGQWSQPPGNGAGKDICADQGKAWVVGMDNAAYVTTASGWVRLSGPSPSLARIAVDRASQTLWAVAVDGRIYSRGGRVRLWTEHPGGGRAKEIAVFAGKAYVIGLDDGIWKSAGANGWQRLTVIQPRG